MISRYQSLGFDVIPVRDKRPAPGFTSRGPYLTAEDAETIDECGLYLESFALILHDYVVLDVDPRNGGYRSLMKLPEMPRTWNSVTRSGGRHFYFKAPKADRPSKPWLGIDCLTGFRYCLEAPTPGYRWLVAPWEASIAALPEWVPTRPDEAPLPAKVERNAFERASAYAEAYPPAISKRGGHNHTFVLAMRLIHQFGLDEGSALAILRKWNQTCRPPWADRDLQHKVKSARQQGRIRVR